MAEATNLLSAFLPKKAATRSTAATTETTKTDLNEDAINEIIRGMMESDSGLASILQGQAGKGLYNSSTSQLLSNDLATRVAGKAALTSAPTTVTRSGTKEKASPGGVDPKMAVGMKLLEALVGKAFGSAPRGGSGGQPRGQTGANPNNSFQSMLDQVLGRKGKQNESGAFADSGTAFSSLGDSGFNPAGSFDFSAPSLGFTGGGGAGSFGGGFGSGTNFDFGGFGGGGYDSLSFGLGGGGYDYNPFSMTGGNNFSLGNTMGNSFGGGSGYDFNANDFSSSFGGSSNSFYEPADYSFGSGSSSFWM